MIPWIVNVRKVFFVVMISVFNTIDVCRFVRKNYDKYLVKNIISFWGITLVSWLIVNRLVQKMCYPGITDPIECGFIEVFSLFVGSVIVNMLIFQLIHGWGIVFAKKFDLKLWLEESIRANSHVMNIISILAIVAAIVTKKYADMLNWLLLSIAMMSVVNVISIELYLNLVMEGFEEKLHIFMHNNVATCGDGIGISARIKSDLIKLAHKYDVDKIVLFGSRARGDNHDKSDIDIAVYGCEQHSRFALDVEEQVWTLLTFDVVDMDKPVSAELRSEIQRDGVVIYEKVR